MSQQKKIRSIAASDDTWEKLRDLAFASNISMSSYIESLINLEIPKPVPPEEWRNVYSEVILISSKLSNITGDSPALEESKELINRLLEEVVKLGIRKWSVQDAGN